LGADVSDREFFESFRSTGTATGYMTRLTIPCDFAGVSFPFHVYVLRGPRGYVELQDQFRWVEEIRGGKVPAKIRSEFDRINQIATTNSVDFRRQCLDEIQNNFGFRELLMDRP
jgi:hypothetical protein